MKTKVVLTTDERLEFSFDDELGLVRIHCNIGARSVTLSPAEMEQLIRYWKQITGESFEI